MSELENWSPNRPSLDLNPVDKSVLGHCNSDGVSSQIIQTLISWNIDQLSKKPLTERRINCQRLMMVIKAKVARPCWIFSGLTVCASYHFFVTFAVGVKNWENFTRCRQNQHWKFMQTGQLIFNFIYIQVLGLSFFLDEIWKLLTSTVAKLLSLKNNPVFCTSCTRPQPVLQTAGDCWTLNVCVLQVSNQSDATCTFYFQLHKRRRYRQLSVDTRQQI